eukprot:6317802-Prymnesium_polylepis.1
MRCGGLERSAARCRVTAEKRDFAPSGRLGVRAAGATTDIEIREPHKSGCQSETLGRINAHPAYRKYTQYAFPSHFGVGGALLIPNQSLGGNA